MDREMNARVSLRYSLLLFPISVGFYHVGMTSLMFIPLSWIVNGYMAYYAILFKKNINDKNARNLFFSSLVHLPVYLILLMVFKTTPCDDCEKEESVEL